MQPSENRTSEGFSKIVKGRILEAAWDTVLILKELKLYGNCLVILHLEDEFYQK
ncbi:hypothetical protein U1E44_05155 [Arenibacter sp. GZD96]|uniref:hypothetical protein n=1 Tax=Aurantibrevibacter litoralis TaxID=3106030 RepID=UPI002AFFEB7D|nr:hypothetical protein [Arenibacter sp. GZD-96]MEA1785469.1 hypothetical protein [Arenibacter sp. GZD-96]